MQLPPLPFNPHHPGQHHTSHIPRPPILSLCCGQADWQVQGPSCSVGPCVGGRCGQWALWHAQTMPGVWAMSDHQGAVWCHQLVSRVAGAVLAGVSAAAGLPAVARSRVPTAVDNEGWRARHAAFFNTASGVLHGMCAGVWCIAWYVCVYIGVLLDVCLMHTVLHVECIVGLDECTHYCYWFLHACPHRHCAQVML